MNNKRFNDFNHVSLYLLFVFLIERIVSISTLRKNRIAPSIIALQSVVWRILRGNKIGCRNWYGNFFCLFFQVDCIVQYGGCCCCCCCGYLLACYSKAHCFIIFLFSFFFFPFLQFFSNMTAQFGSIHGVNASILQFLLCSTSTSSLVYI